MCTSMIPMGQIWVEIMIGGIWANWIKIAPSDPPGRGLKLRILFPNTTVEVGIIGRNNRCFAEIKTGFPEFILTLLVLFSRDSLYISHPHPILPFCILKSKLGRKVGSPSRISNKRVRDESHKSVYPHRVFANFGRKIKSAKISV